MLKRGGLDIPVKDVNQLRKLATEGGINPSDYVFNPVLNQWMYAKDAAELASVFTTAGKNESANTLNKAGMGFGIVGIVLCMTPLMPLGALLVLVGIVLSIAYYIKRA